MSDSRNPVVGKVVLGAPGPTPAAVGWRGPKKRAPVSGGAPVQAPAPVSGEAPVQAPAPVSGEAPVRAVTLRRDGDSPLAFYGEVLADVSDPSPADEPPLRWHEMTLYRVASGKFVLRVAYLSRWKGEFGHSDVDVVANIGEVRKILREYDPTSYVVGFPPGVQYAEKQRRLMDDITARYDAQVADILSRFPEQIA